MLLYLQHLTASLQTPKPYGLVITASREFTPIRSEDNVLYRIGMLVRECHAFVSGDVPRLNRAVSSSDYQIVTTFRKCHGRHTALLWRGEEAILPCADVPNTDSPSRISRGK